MATEHRIPPRPRLPTLRRGSMAGQRRCGEGGWLARGQGGWPHAAQGPPVGLAVVAQPSLLWPPSHPPAEKHVHLEPGDLAARHRLTAPRLSCPGPPLSRSPHRRRPAGAARLPHRLLAVPGCLQCVAVQHKRLARVRVDEQGAAENAHFVCDNPPAPLARCLQIEALEHAALVHLASLEGLCGLDRPPQLRACEHRRLQRLLSLVLIAADGARLINSAGRDESNVTHKEQVIRSRQVRCCLLLRGGSAATPHRAPVV
eukprot:scaffold141589_cov223-Phaeocystis_antarctica.AAC.1